MISTQLCLVALNQLTEQFHRFVTFALGRKQDGEIVRGSQGGRMIRAKHVCAQLHRLARQWFCLNVSIQSAKKRRTIANHLERQWVPIAKRSASRRLEFAKKSIRRGPLGALQKHIGQSVPAEKGGLV